MVKWTENKDRIKDVFDNISNLLICGAVLYGGKFILHLPAQDSFQKWLNIICAIILFIVSPFLIYFNVQHAILTILPNYQREHSFKKRAIFSVVVIIYILLAIDLVMSAVSK